jgi:hypothetical protein
MQGTSALDHVGIVGRELAPLIAAYRRLGFALTEPSELLRVDPQSGATQGTGQWSCHAVFRRGYLELSALLVDDPAHHLTPLLDDGGGLRIVVHTSESLVADRERCIAEGLAVGPPARASRPIEYGRRHGLAQFEWFRVDPPGGAAARGLTAYVRHLSPDLVFQPEVMTHPNGALALLGVQPFDSFTVGVADLVAARRLFEAQGVHFLTLPDGTLEVGSDLAGGATLRLVAAGGQESWSLTGPARARLS